MIEESNLLTNYIIAASPEDTLKIIQITCTLAVDSILNIIQQVELGHEFSQI